MTGHSIGSAAQTITLVAASGTLANLGELNGGGTFAKTTGGTLIMAGTSTYTGATAVQEGRMILQGGASNRISSSTSVVLGNLTTSGVLQLGDASGTSDQTVGSLASSGTGTANAVVGGNAASSTLTVNQSTTTTYAGTIGGTGTNENNLNLVMSGPGTLILSGTNTYSGTTTVSGGTLSISSSSNLGDGSATNTIALSNGAALQNTGASVDLGTNRSVSLGSGGGAVDVAASDVLTISGVVSGSTLTKTGAGTVVLSASNTYTGSTVIAAGRISISSEANLGVNPASPSPSQLTLNGGTLQTTATLTIDDSNRGITVAASGGAIETASGTTATVSSVITGGGTLAKEGAGTLVFTAVNTNTGSTNVNNGILAGTGVVGADLNVNSGGAVAPGITAEGRLTVGGNLTISSGGTLVMQLGGTTTNDAATVKAQMDASNNLSGLAGSVPSSWTTYVSGTTLHDNILVNGALVPTINGTVKIDSSYLYGYTPSYGDIFKLIDWTATGSIVGTTSFDYTGVVLGGGLSFNTDLFASSGVIVVVPEPSRVFFLMLGLFGLCFRRRRSAR